MEGERGRGAATHRYAPFQSRTKQSNEVTDRNEMIRQNRKQQQQQQQQQQQRDQMEITHANNNNIKNETSNDQY